MLTRLNQRENNADATLDRADQRLGFQSRRQLAKLARTKEGAFVARITQVAHGFTAGKAVQLSAGSWALATPTTALALDTMIGLVTSVVSADLFIVCLAGPTTITGLTPLTTYYLALAGALTTTRPTSGFGRAILVVGKNDRCEVLPSSALGSMAVQNASGVVLTGSLTFKSTAGNDTVIAYGVSAGDAFSNITTGVYQWASFSENSASGMALGTTSVPSALSGYSVGITVGAAAYVSIGQCSSTGGTNSMAIGYSSTAVGNGAFAIGASCSAGDIGCVAIGSSATASDDYAVAIGHSVNATFPGAVAIGVGCTASAQDAVSIGYGTIASDSYSGVIGGDNSAGSWPSNGIATLSLYYTGGIYTNGSFYRNGVQILGTQGATVSAPAGGATVDSQARTAINSLISRLQGHGLIA